MLLAVKLDALTWGGPRAQANCQVSLRGALWSTEKILCQVVAVLKAATKTSQNNHFDCTWHCRCSQPFAAGISKVRSCFFLKSRVRRVPLGWLCQGHAIIAWYQTDSSQPSPRRRHSDMIRTGRRRPGGSASFHQWSGRRCQGGNTIAGAREISVAWRGLGVWWMFDGVCVDFLMDLFDGFVWWILLMDSLWDFMGIRSWMTCLKMVWECREGNFQTEMASKGDKFQTRTMFFSVTLHSLGQVLEDLSSLTQEQVKMRCWPRDISAIGNWRVGTSRHNSFQKTLYVVSCGRNSVHRIEVNFVVEWNRLVYDLYLNRRRNGSFHTLGFSRQLPSHLEVQAAFGPAFRWGCLGSKDWSSSTKLGLSQSIMTLSYCSSTREILDYIDYIRL